MTKLILLTTTLLPTLALSSSSSSSLPSQNIVDTLPAFYPVKNVNKISVPPRLVPPPSKVRSGGDRKLATTTSRRSTPPPPRDTTLLPNVERKLPDSEDSCEQNWFNCLDDANCNQCTIELDGSSLDYFDLPASTTCDTLMDLIYEQDVCLNLKEAQGSKDLFCDAFTSCIDDVGYEDDYGDNDDWYSGEIDCDLLTECNWSGIVRNFIGDGVCDQWTVSGEGNCYNHKICGYDNGDCCEDKCTSNSEWTECGENGWYCKDPESATCWKDQNPECPEKPPPIPPPTPVCETGEHLYRINEFDSFGDGWDSNKLVLKNLESNKEIYNGGLEDGNEGYVEVCLEEGCHQVECKAQGSEWGNEISWEIKKNNGGTKVASGGSPASCTFSIGNNFCDNTCDGSIPPPAPIDPTDNDDDEMTELLQCIATSCAIQIAACTKDIFSCAPCLIEQQSYCLTNENYKAIVSCAMCQCEDGDGPECEGGDNSGGSCNSQQVVEGTVAATKWNMCSKINDASTLVTEWDEDNFGALDLFEACAHSYTNDANHGGKNAEDCMAILYQASISEEKDIVESISSKLYTTPGGFCACSSEANTAVPKCDTFTRFKTLIHETLDACNSLDEIDCDAWKEFSDKCTTKMIAEFGSIDFTKTKQCKYIENGCDGAGPFPAFRKLDCGGEIPKKNWDMWNSYSVDCAIQDNDDYVPEPKPEPKPPTPPSPTPPSPTPPSPTPPSPTPDETPQTHKAKSGAAGPVLGVMASFGLVAGGAFFYKKRKENGGSFGFAGSSQYKYRAQRDDSDSGQEMFAGMAVNTSGFVPPVLQDI